MKTNERPSNHFTHSLLTLIWKLSFRPSWFGLSDINQAFSRQIQRGNFPKLLHSKVNLKRARWHSWAIPFFEQTRQQLVFWTFKGSNSLLEAILKFALKQVPPSKQGNFSHCFASCFHLVLESFECKYEIFFFLKIFLKPSATQGKDPQD